jgi:Methyltransferase domain
MVAPSFLKKWLYAPVEIVRTLLFHLSFRRRSRWRRMNADCNSASDHFSFAQEVFHSCQKRSEIVAFMEYVASAKPEVIVEIGVARSGTSYLLCNSSPCVRLFIGIDYFVRNGARLRAFTSSKLDVHAINGASCADSTLSALEKYLNGRKIDLLFIDGDHRYDGVKRDLLRYLPFLAPQGRVAFHDIIPPFRDGNGNYVNDWVIEVHKLWGEIKCHGQYREFIDNDKQHANGIGVISVCDPAGFSSAVMSAGKGGDAGI